MRCLSRWILPGLLLAALLLATPAAAELPIGAVQAAGGQGGEGGQAAEGGQAGEGSPQPAGEAEPVAGEPGGPARARQAGEEPLEARTWSSVVNRLLERFVAFLPDILYALIILVVFFFLYKVSARLFSGLMRRTSADPALGAIGARIARVVLLGLGLVMAAGQLGFEVGSLLAGIGVVGLAVGLAAQDTLANFIAGLTILWDRPFRIGDNVTIAGTFGRVEEIGLRSTRIRTVDERHAVLPNKDVINQKILNHTLSPRLRLDVPVGIAYKEDVRQARAALLAAVDGHSLLLPDPPPQVVVVGLGESSVDLQLRVWPEDPHQETRVMSAMLELAKASLDQAGIEIPFPQRTLHLGNEALADGLKRRLGAAESDREAR